MVFGMLPPGVRIRLFLVRRLEHAMDLWQQENCVVNDTKHDVSITVEMEAILTLTIFAVINVSDII